MSSNHNDDRSQSPTPGTSRSTPYPVPAHRLRVPTVTAPIPAPRVLLPRRVSESSSDSIWESYEDIELEELQQETRSIPYVEPRSVTLECNLCCESYKEKENKATFFLKPKICNHSMCFKCVVKLCEKNNGITGNNVPIRCPYCNGYVEMWEAHTETAVIECRLVRKGYRKRAQQAFANYWNNLRTRCEIVLDEENIDTEIKRQSLKIKELEIYLSNSENLTETFGTFLLEERNKISILKLQLIDLEKNLNNSKNDNVKMKEKIFEQDNVIVKINKELVDLQSEFNYQKQKSALELEVTQKKVQDLKTNYDLLKIENEKLQTENIIFRHRFPNFKKY